MTVTTEPTDRETLPGRIHRWLRRRFIRTVMRGTRYADRHERFDLAYRLSDPWKMHSSREQTRFAATNAIIEREFGRVGRILELGSGEGHQSEHLAQLCDELHGIEPSARAVERARERLPRSRFDVGDLFAQPWLEETGRYDLVVGCEMLYYIADLPRLLSTVSRLGHGCLFTYLERAEELDAPLAAMPGAGHDVIEAEGERWKAVWWRSGLAGRRSAD